MFGKALAGVLAMVAGLGVSAAAAGTLEDVLARGTLRVGVVSESFVPYVMVDEDGDLIGLEIDVATRLASDLGVRVEFVQRPLPALIASLLTHESDVIVSALSITAPRAKLGMFSRPYSHSEVNVLARVEAGAAAPSLEALDAEGATIGATAGTVAEFVAQQAFHAATVRSYPDDSALKQALVSGEIAALVASSPLPELLVATGTDELAIVGEPLVGTAEAMMVRPGEFRFLNFLDSWVAEVEASGFLKRRNAYWLDGHDWEDRLTKPEVEDVE